MAALAVATVGGLGFGIAQGLGTGPRVNPAAPGPVVPTDPSLASCTLTHNPDGTLLRQTTQRIKAVGSKAIATVVIVDFLRTDKTRVVVRTGNTSDLKYGGNPGPGSTPAPPPRSPPTRAGTCT